MRRSKGIILLVFCLAFGLSGLCSCDDEPHLIEQQQQPEGGSGGGFTMQQQQNQNGGGGGFTSQSSAITWMQTPVTSNSWGNPSGYNTWGNPSGYNTLGASGGYDNSWGQTGGGYNTYSTQKPTDYGQMVDMGGTAGYYGQQMPASGQMTGHNSLWIVDVTGLNYYPSLSVPLYGYAREEITPSMEGYLTLEEMYPNGQVKTFSMGYVQPYHTYKMWFYADVPGTHLIRYNVNGYYSDIIRFYVQGGSAGGSYAPTTSRTTSVIGGGTTVRGSRSTTVSGGGGSISISTSF